MVNAVGSVIASAEARSGSSTFWDPLVNANIDTKYAFSDRVRAKTSVNTMIRHDKQARLAGVWA